MSWNVVETSKVRNTTFVVYRCSLCRKWAVAKEGERVSKCICQK